MRLLDKVVLVAGAGPGIGRATAIVFAAEGAKVLIASIDEGDLRITANEIKRRGGSAEVIVGDASKTEDAERMVESTVRAFGRLDILHNNISGGWTELGRKLHEISPDAFRLTVSNNLVAVYNLCKAGVLQMLRQGSGGSIINVSASRNVRRQANPIYAYTKAGIVELTLHMANDYRKDGIRVNCILPGLIMTGPFDSQDLRPVTKQLLRAESAAARQGHPIDIAFAAAYLASDEASFVTGQCLGIDGGDDTKLTDIVIDTAS